MNKSIVFCFSCFFYLFIIPDVFSAVPFFMDNLQWDSIIQAVTDEVDTDSITSYIQRLQDFQTRYVLTDSSYAASQWIKQCLEGWGYQAQFDSFMTLQHDPPYNTGWERNVVATLSGSMNPEKEFIILGHFDSYSWDALNCAPGADDNASGTSAVLEAARVLSDFFPEKSLIFLATGAEESGLIGSQNYANNAFNDSADIAAVINYDMIGHRDDSLIDLLVSRICDNSLWLSEFYVAVSNLYVTPLTNDQILGSGLDGRSFALLGYPAIDMSERAQTHGNPNMHQTTDLLSTLNPEQFTTIIKSAVSVLAVMSIYPAAIENVRAVNTGNGTSVLLTWNQSLETDISHYKIYLGESSQNYQETLLIAGTGTVFDTLENLTNGQEYYVSVTATDYDGRESYMVFETTFVADDIPTAPANITALPVSDGIQISWSPNNELDLAGYRIFRGVNQDSILDSMNISYLMDTIFTDLPLSGADKYYYAVKAYDLDSNAGPLSDIAYGRPLSLDQGILIVDETKNTGPYIPSDSVVDAFYRSILRGYRISEYDYSEIADKPVFADFAPYSTIVWHSDEYWTSAQYLAKEASSDIRQYLSSGGNFWMIGYQSASNLGDLPTSHGSIPAGNIVRDYFKIDSINISGNHDSFQAAIGDLQYPSLWVDPSKILYTPWGQTLRYIETYIAISGGEFVYNTDMSNYSSSYQNLPCAVRYLGSDCKTVLFGFPLYYMNEFQAREAAIKVMTDFGEAVCVEENTKPTSLPSVIILNTTPGIFRDRVYISFAVPGDCHASLKIYDSSGRIVDVLLDKIIFAGYYNFTWNNENCNGQTVAPGLYFCRLTAGVETVSAKITVVE